MAKTFDEAKIEILEALKGFDVQKYINEGEPLNVNGHIFPDMLQIGYEYGNFFCTVYTHGQWAYTDYPEIDNGMELYSCGITPDDIPIWLTDDFCMANIAADFAGDFVQAMSN